MTEWQGWVVGDSALFLHQKTGTPYVRLCIQHGNDVRELAQFFHPDGAVEVQAWLNYALTAVGAANLELTRLLEAERG